MRVDAFRPADEFLNHMDNWIRAFRNANPVNPEQPVQIPGDAERIAKSERLTAGIPIINKVVDDLKGLAEELNIPFPA
jgi:L-2-hydroxycarboxylate dehydrogenase (NAD+)